MKRFVWILVKSLSHLPFCILYAMSDLLRFVLYNLLHYRVDVVRENLKYSFPEYSQTQLKKIEKDFYKHLADLFFESIKLLSISEESMARRMKYINYQPMIDHYAEGRCVMLITSHYGNWEWTSTFSSLLPKDKPVYQVYKQQSDPISDYIAFKIRRKFGAENVEMKRVLRTLVEMKKNNKLGMYGMISDQSPEWNSMHYYTNFLNQNTAVITGTEQLAKKFDFPVYYVRLKKLKRGHYTCEPIPITTQPKEMPDYQISEKYMRMLEEDIEKDPAIWLWSHKRWKFTRDNEN